MHERIDSPEAVHSAKPATPTIMYKLANAYTIMYHVKILTVPPVADRLVVQQRLVKQVEFFH